tara:strand:+ start:841 stop:1515 length:675 start_codon:yes stop_codon:yes gene_type:complete
MSYLDNIYNSNNYEYLNPSQNRYGNLELVDYPATQVVTTPELKSQLRIDTSDEDVLLATYISAATQMAENYCNRHFITAKYKLWFNDLPSKFSLYYPDCKFNFTASDPAVAGEIDGLYSLKLPGTTYTLFSNSEWRCNTNTNPNVVILHSTPIVVDKSDLDGTNEERYYFQFQTGIGDAASDIPDAIKQAIKLIASDMYYFREDRKRAFPMASEILLQPYKCYL